MSNLWAVILAAGEGKRMHSSLPKVLHKLCGKPMLQYILDSAAALTANIIVVVGHGASDVRGAVGERYLFAHQEQQLGTGHALMQAADKLPDSGRILVLCGDTPLIDKQLLQKMVAEQGENAATVAVTTLDNPEGYGRIIRNRDGVFSRIVEERDADRGELSVKEINTGTYCFDLKLLKHYLPLLSAQNAQQEYYLPDVLKLMLDDGHTVGTFSLEDSRIGLGINNRDQMAEAESLLRESINRFHMLNGVTIRDPASTYIDHGVKIGVDTLILPGSILEGATAVGSSCVIGPGTFIRDAVIEDGGTVAYSMVNNTTLPKGSRVGPFAQVGSLPY